VFTIRPKDIVNSQGAVQLILLKSVRIQASRFNCDPAH